VSVAVKNILRASRPPGAPDRALAFLLRCHKGRFYRNRYPSQSLVQSGET
jgi:hypothetical protein